MIWFLSDPHFEHSKVIELSKRPFSSVEEMDDTIINNINFLVGRNDILYLLGDFAFGKKEDFKKYRKRIECGTVNLIIGNHDLKNLSKKALTNVFGFAELIHVINPYIPELGEKKKIVMCHYPMKEWPGSQRGSWHLHGHCHGNLPEDDSLSFDVGVDCWDYKPVSLEQVTEKMLSKMEIQNGSTTYKIS